MKLEKLFDFVCDKSEAKGEAFKHTVGGKELTVTPKVSENIITSTIQAFIHRNAGQVIDADKKLAIQAFEGSSALPKLTTDVFNVTMAVDEFDLLWQKCFKGVKLKKGQLEWEIATVASAIVFELIPEGAKAKFEKVSGSKVNAAIKKYGAGIGVTWETIEGRKLYKFVEQMEAARAALYSLWADIHYGLLATAAASNTVAWVAGTTTLERDIATLNSGAYQNALANKDKGYGDTANMQFELYCSPLLRARINQALSATGSDIIQSGRVLSVKVDYPITANYTFNSAITANTALLVLPGHKIQNAVYMQELGLSRQEIESLNELRTYWTAFGATVADTDQCYQLSFA